jgi:CRISPR-associated protein Cpf1
LFQIYNKDFSVDKKEWSKENIHTKYFKLMFDEKNLENLVIKLSWWAEIFFRDKTDNLKKKLDKSWKEILDHRRYANDKIMLHLSITLNANKWDSFWFNKMINKYLNKNEDIKIIWIDRWEKHLAYYSVIDKTWKIYEINTLNIVNGINYLEKLEKIEGSRKNARVSWWEIESIKELKNGYISQVINKLAELIIKYNAIIIFEDLNIWFKRWRQKIEKQIYQKLELALAKKLNYLTQKDKKDDEILWNLKALQLVPKISDYQDIAKYKQSGIMFYTRANYTSTTCPCCWFRKNLYISNSDTKEKQKKVFEKIDIKFDWEKFIFSYEIPKEVKSQSGKKQILNRTNFSINSDILRLKYDTKKMSVETIEINQKLIELFKNIDLKWNINNQILDKDGSFYKSLTYYFNLILQLRNSDSKNDIDYISCPACHFHSKDCFQGLDYNADANWAYNIARKGIIMLERIEKNIEKPDLYVSDVDWDNFNVK